MLQSMNDTQIPFESDALDLLDTVRSAGIRLYLADDQLKFSAPKGAMDDNMIEALRFHKLELIRILKHEEKGRSLLEKSILSSHNITRTANPQVDGYPLSFAQQRFWFLDQLAGGNSPIYNMLPIALKADGPLQIEVLRAVFQDLIQRHAGLSTKFDLKNGEPKQWPGQGGEVPFTIYDLTGADNDIARINKIILEEGERLFDLKKGEPLVRVGVIRFAIDRHILVLTLHHICADGWSLGNLVGEISALYESKISGKKAQLPQLSVQYGDFALWERTYMDPHRIQRSIHHWKKLLHGAPFFLDLPTDRPRPRLQTFNGRTLPFTVDEASTSALRAIAITTSTTPYMVLLSVFAILLARYSRQDDLIIGSPISARVHPDSEPLVGLFLNTLPMRVDLSGSPDFYEVLKRVRTMSLQAFEKGEVPFDELLQALNVGRSLNHTPLFQVLFALQNAPSGELRAGDIKLTDIEPENSKAPFDLVLSMEELGPKIHGRFRYNTDLFDDDSVRRMSGHFTALLNRLITQPDAPVHRIQFTTDAEIDELRALRGSRDTFTVNETLQQVLNRSVNEHARRTALRFDGQSYTYEWLGNRAASIAEQLAVLGVKRNDRIGVYMLRSPDLIASLVAILSLGASYVPLDPVYPSDRLTFMIEDSGLKVVLTDSESESGLPAAGQTNINVTLVHEKNAQDGLNVQNGGSATGSHEDVAYIIYTSGSTGLPKGVEVTHANVIRLFRSTEAYYEFDSNDVWTLFHSYAFDFSVWEIFGALLYGGTLVIVPRDTARETDVFYQLLIREKVTVLNQTPSAFGQLVEVDRRESIAKNHLRWVIFGGEALDPRSLEGWFQRHGYQKPRLVNMYGITETTVHVTWHEITVDDVRNGASVIGTPIPDLSLDLCDDYGQLVPVGIPGEIVVGGPGVAKGYLNRPELNAQRFITAELFPAMPPSRYYRSGDLARRRTDGSLHYLGRIDHQVKVRGFRIELGEIESLMKSFAGVQAAAVKVIRSASGNELAGYVVFQPGVDAAEQMKALRVHLLLKLPEYMIPSAIVSLAHMPLTNNGKTDLKALPEPGRDNRLSATDFVEPRNELERFIATLWSDILRIPKIGIHDNFFELGGDSIKAAIFANRMQESFGSIFYVVAIFEAPSIAELFDYIGIHYPEMKSHFSGMEVDGQASLSCITQSDVTQLASVIPVLKPFKHAQKTKKNRQAIFVLAPPRSGTTLLRVLLGGHPRLFAPPELELMPFNTLKERAQTYTGRDSFWMEGTIRALMEASNMDATAGKLAMEAFEEADLSVKDFYGELQQLIGDKILVDKSPSYVLHRSILDRIEDTFEDPLYIHLHRHPLGMVHSFEEAKLHQIFFRYRHTFAPRELAELIWLQSHANIEAFLGSVPQNRHTRISFEDMTGDPENQMERLCSFIGIPYDPQMLSLYNEQDKKRRMTDGLHAESRMLGDVKFHTHKKIDPNASERWRERYSEDILGDPTRMVAANLGYDLSTPDKTLPQTMAPLFGGPLSATKPVGIHAVARTESAASHEGTAVRPLSLAQKRLWFFEQLESGKATYNMPVTLKLHGNLNVDALQRTIDQLQQRHEVLRSSIETVNGDPAAKVRPNSAPTGIVDVSSLDAVFQQDHLNRWVEDFCNEPFNLTLGPLFRSVLVRIDNDRHLLIINMHHAVSDGWSLGIIAKELENGYKAIISDTEMGLPALELQYADYAIWQNDLIESGEIRRQTEYWEAKLADLPALLELPTDFPRPTVKSYKGATLRFELGADLTQKVRKLAESSNTTPFMVLLAVYGIVLHRYSGQRDIPIGSPFANRKKSAFESLVGFFVNTQVLRLGIDPKQTFEHLLRQVRATALEAYAHQDVSFEHLVEALQPERNMGYSPLFQVMMTMQTNRMDPPHFPGVQSRILEHQNTIAKYDLTLLFAEEGDTLAGYLEYSTDLFEEWRIKQMAEHIAHILSQVSIGDDRTIDQIPLQSESSVMAMLTKWNQTYRPIDFSRSIVDIIDEQAQLQPDKIAVYAVDRSLTYGQLKDESDKIAAHIRRLGLPHGSNIVVALERKADLITSMLAIWKAGHTYIPLDPAYPLQRIEMIFEDAEVALLLTHSDVASQFPDTVHRLLVDTLNLHDVDTDLTQQQSLTPADIAYIIFTSGSTGRPKGVMVPHGALLNFIFSMQREPGLSSRDKMLALTTISFDIAVIEIWVMLVTGGSFELASETIVKDPAAIIQRISQGDINILQATPATWSMMVEYGWNTTHDMMFISGGETLSLSLAQVLATKCTELWNHYGPTETTVYSTNSIVEKSIFKSTKSLTIGRPMDNTFVYILDDNLQPLPPGLPGFLYIGGMGVAAGYMNRPDLTIERFITDPYAPDIAKNVGFPYLSLYDRPMMYNTGDLASFLPDGTIDFIGRSDQQVKLRGFRIELGEIEAHLNTLPNVITSAVVMHGSGIDAKLVAYLIPKPNSSIIVSEIVTHLRPLVPDYMIPSHFILVSAFPMTPNGKLDRKELSMRAIDSVNSDADDHVQARDVFEFRMATIWKSVLDIHTITPYHNFFDLGGHSLIAVRLMAMVNAEFGVHLPLATLFQNPTLEAFSNSIRLHSEAGASWPTIMPLNSGHDQTRTLVLLPGAGGNILYMQSLASAIEAGIPVYGLQPPGLDGVSPTHDTIEQLAAHYLDVIETSIPGRILTIAGHSFGGLVAFEMARQLENNSQDDFELGHKILILDSPAPQWFEPTGRDWSMDKWTRQVAEIASHQFAQQVDMGDDLVDSDTDRSNPIQKLLDALIQAGIFPPQTPLRQLEGFLNVYRSNLQMEYKPTTKVKRLDVSLIRSADLQPEHLNDKRVNDVRANPDLGWSEWVQSNLNIIHTPGDHLTMLNDPHVSTLAGIIAEQTIRK